MIANSPLLDHDNPLPLYHQIANILRSQLDMGEWSEGEKLPSEAALAATFNASFLTVRQALAVLVQEGRLRREQGRGTFVLDQKAPTLGVYHLAVDFDELSQTLAHIKHRLLDWGPVRGPQWVMAALGIPSGAGLVRIRRVAIQGRQVVSYTTTYLPASMGSRLSPADLTRPLLFEVIEESTGMVVQQASQTIEAALADPDAAAALRVPLGSPLLLVRRYYELETGTVGYVAVHYSPGPLVRYQVQLTRHRTPDA